MKTISLYIIAVFISITSVSIAQWQPEARLTVTGSSYTSQNNAWCIGANSNFIHVVWQDWRDGNTEIYYKKSTDNGIIWEVDTRLTNNISYSGDPSISVSGSFVHVVWADSRNGSGEIYYKLSTDNGLTWGVDTRLTNNPASSISPSMAISGNVINITWSDMRDGNWEIYTKRSTNNGTTWGVDIRLTNNTASSIYSSIASSGVVNHIVWEDDRDGGGYYQEIYYKRSTDGGSTWDADFRLTYDSSHSRYPTISASGLFVHTAWSDYRDTNWEIYYKKSTDAGLNWTTDRRITNLTNSSDYPSISVSGTNIHIVWRDNSNGNYEIYYKGSFNNGEIWGIDTRLTNNAAMSTFPSITVYGPALHVVWRDDRNSNPAIYYMSNPNGNVVGIEQTSSEIPAQFNLHQNYPNPFNPITKIRFDVSKSSFVGLKIFDALGREVAKLVNEDLKPGTYEVDWTASHKISGIYYYKLETESYSETKKMVLIK